MKKLMLISAILMCMVASHSCKNSSGTDGKTLLTERIQYPVFIKSPYGDDVEWYKENMEGRSREKFVNILLDGAFDGKVKTYDYVDDAPLSKEQLQQIVSRTDTVHMIRPLPPYEEFDTVIVTKLERKNIHRITFLEEWYFDEKEFSMTKKVVGIAPALTMYSDSNNVKGYKPLFWIYLDDKYPLKK